jgi:hypothetical protein
MVALMAVGLLVVIWALVLWGSIYFNRNVV